MEEKEGINCLECGTNIEHIRWKQKFCSAKCRNKFNNEINAEKIREYYQKKIKPYKKKPKERKRNCKFCNKEFTYTRSHKLYCNKECASEFYKDRWRAMSKGIIIRTNNKLANFYKLRFEIFKRDNFSCQYCGRNVKEDKIKLHIDHIYPKKKGGLFVSDNLTTSCEECNEGKKDVLLEKKALIEAH